MKKTKKILTFSVFGLLVITVLVSSRNLFAFELPGGNQLPGSGERGGMFGDRSRNNSLPVEGQIPSDISEIVDVLPEEYQDMLPGREGIPNSDQTPGDFEGQVPQNILDKLPGGYQNMLPDGAAGGNISQMEGMYGDLGNIFNQSDCSAVDCSIFDLDGNGSVGEGDVAQFINCLEDESCLPEDLGLDSNQRLDQGMLKNAVGCCISLEDAKSLWTKYRARIKELLPEAVERVKRARFQVPDMSDVDCSGVDCSLYDANGDGSVNKEDAAKIINCLRNEDCNPRDYAEEMGMSMNQGAGDGIGFGMGNIKKIARCCLSDQELESLFDEYWGMMGGALPKTFGNELPQDWPNCPAFEFGDANCDGMVEDLDYVVWWDSFGEKMRADFNFDSLTDDLDYVSWWKNFDKDFTNLFPTGISFPE